MKELLYTFIILLFHQILFSQSDTIYISGKVFAQNNFKKPESITKAHVHLKLNNGEQFETTTNDTGFYCFKIKTTQSTGFITVATDKNSAFERSKLYGCYPSKDIAKFDFSENKKFIRDFELTKTIVCLMFPTLLFKPNSTESNGVYHDTISVNDAIDQLYSDLFNNPEVIIEISGSCDSNENKVDELSSKRANLIADQLIKKGINSQRLRIRAIGYQIGKVRESDLTKKTEKEKAELHQAKRSVNFRVVSWDFADPNILKFNKSDDKENSEFVED
jgi:outer membrane protein OmpA-like peptidoglycan-associated protein